METIHKSAWICLADKKMLFARSKGKDVFYLPGGTREAGESDIETLLREAREETGAALEVDSIALYRQFTVPAHGREDTEVRISAFFAAHSGELQSMSEIEELMWFSSLDTDKVPLAGQLLLGWLKEEDLID